MTSALVLIGSFDSSGSEAASRNIALGETLARHADVWCVGDDLDLLPDSPEGGPTYMHWRHYLADETLSRLSRLHLADRDTAGGILFQALRARPGALMIFTDTLFEAFVDDFKRRGEWPHGFANLLVATYDEEGDVLAEALVNRRRFTDGLAAAMPALKPAADLADGVFTASPHIASLLAAEGVSTTVLKAPPLAPQKRRAPNAVREIVIACTETSSALQAAVDAIRRLGWAVRLTSAPHAPGLAGATIAVHLHADPAPAWSPFVRTAAEAGVPLVHASPHMPSDVGVRIDHADAHHQLVAAIGALASDASLAEARATTLHAWLSGLTNTDDVTRLLSALKTPASTQAEAPVAVKATGAVTLSQVPPKGRTMLIGAAPGPAVMANIWPDADAITSPRFAAAALAKRLGETTGLPVPGLLARLGFEAPVIGTDADLQHQRNGLRAIDTVSCAAAPWQGGAVLLLQPSVATGDASWRACAEGGTLWMLDHRGLAIRCLLLAGGDRPVYFENRGETSVRIASMDRTFDLPPGTQDTVAVDTCGLAEFRLRLIHSAEGQVSPQAQMTRWLANTGLWMTR
ncbi:hypothetical protein [Gimibacter soli]|uniref:Uncharacterized protein n=1 Tax=Gimibacter soli TaxID=3024400 RepID=A0AAE9XUA6_9PROT|nr:hypothetical protein [Gimibacter soli]WCL55116.1 hypothetical protein PH603_05010 [Gimibacter soli]